MNPNEPIWTHLLKEGPKPSQVPCLPRLAVAAVVLGLLVTGLVIW